MECVDAEYAVAELCRDFPALTQQLQVFLSEQFWTQTNKHILLNELADLLLISDCTLRVAEYFSPILLDLLNRCIATEADGETNLLKHEALCLALAKLIWLFPDVAKFAYKYFEGNQSIFAAVSEKDDEKEENGSKKGKKTPEFDSQLRPLLEAALQFLAFDWQYFRTVWDWSILVLFAQNEDADVRWLAYICLARVNDINSQHLTVILQENFDEATIVQLTAKYGQFLSFIANYDPLNQSRSPGLQDELPDSDNNRKITDSDLSENLVDVFGVLLPKVSGVQVVDFEELVVVDTVREAIYELALAISSGAPVLLQGPVGSGKTSLIEHFAYTTGHKLGRDFFKVQLSDQMDCKVLLGSYCCTEVPGEFVWKAGILTQAMMGGHWLVLEDIDCAPMDIISLLMPLLESQSLTLPGRIAPVQAKAGFKLFATQRLLKGHGGEYVEFKSRADMLNKFWRKISVEDLPLKELKEVIYEKWPDLHPIADRILRVYYLFCCSTLDEYECDDDEDDDLPKSATEGRLISTRDLYKFCNRIAKRFDIQSAETAATTFQHAVDCFCDNIPDINERILAAECVGVKFNIPKSKASYFCCMHKPEVIVSSDVVKIGRAVLQKKCEETVTIASPSSVRFAQTRQAVSLLEKVAVAVEEAEPVLLVGETGTGKTSIVQYLARITGNTLSVINMNQQSESIDLIGGYKPVDLKFILSPLKEEYEEIFPMTFSQTKNAKFLGHIVTCFSAKRWEDLFILMLTTQKHALEYFVKKSPLTPTESKLQKRWKKLGNRIKQLKLQLNQTGSPLAFSFIEGALVKAMKNGDWILLDEINLAEAEMLQSLAGVLEKDGNSVFLLEKGDKQSVFKHPNFRLFACMNPATDVGKKDLPVGIRNRFTEFFMEELDDQKDLMVLVHHYLYGLTLPDSTIQNIVDFYLHVRKEAVYKLNDGTGHQPHFSLRTLCRALMCASLNSCGSIPRSLYEAFCLSFLSQLDSASHPVVNEAVLKYVIGKKQQPLLKQGIPEPRSEEGKYIPVQGYWISAGPSEPDISEKYILTKSVQRNLHDLARIVSLGQFPVLLQGETSVGKTSLVQWLASATGNHCVRVNNHEHTDIQEYIGSYCVNDHGKLVFTEGVLVRAMRKGYWIILDELNLAPTEVMEALNRVLDDNRELFVTETQKTVKAHPKFRIFATQNPPGLYGGRKILSKAFRNRFIELHFNEIPSSELEIILQKRCSVPLSYSKKMVAVMLELQIRRRESGIFAGKQGYITLRDLFRWGERYRLADSHENELYDWGQHLADEGYLLLAGRVRRSEEAELIQDVIAKHMKRKVDPEVLFSFDGSSPTTADVLSDMNLISLHRNFKHLVLTYNMRRMLILVAKALKFQEPVLLVGETGCGKTTICQVLAKMYKKKLEIVNCHMHSESSDFLGGLRPVRHENVEDSQKLFEWADGPLVTSMRDGAFFLCDEISLADDSVLERLNSLLEPERSIYVIEKAIGDRSAYFVAEEGFRFMSTMNPGGDYGKKELSPALRNRFTEIWCPSNLDNCDLFSIVEHNIKDGVYFLNSENRSGFGLAMIEFLKWFSQTDVGRRVTVSIRDILTWVDFINATVICEEEDGETSHGLSAGEAFIHGACMVFLDGLGSSITYGSRDRIEEIKKLSYKFLFDYLEENTDEDIDAVKDGLKSNWQVSRVHIDSNYFSIDPFFIESDSDNVSDISDSYYFNAPTVKANAIAILRAMQLDKPILLEGSPGVGKTSLIAAIARAAGYKLVRINLSEQTDVSDLFGADLPVDGGESGQFEWRYGPLLQAIMEGHWVLLDELNLASQSVLEGLNACLDHRGEVYVPELGHAFHIERHTTRIFGCQNPYKDGGSRKGLPRSFLNRFSQVYMQPLTSFDFELIVSALYPALSPEVISSMISFNEEIVKLIVEERQFGHDGYPWEFNLRDIFRWCDLMKNSQSMGSYDPREFVSLLYSSRMRTNEDRAKMRKVYENVFHSAYNNENRYLKLNVLDEYVQLGHAFLPRLANSSSKDHLYFPLHCHLRNLECLMKCIEMKWMAILVGPPASGKTTIVQMLASLTGNPLKVLAVNSEMDTTELLGGFEQADLNRAVDYILLDLEPFIQQAIHQCLLRTPPNSPQMLYFLLQELFKMHSLNRFETAATVTDAVAACRDRVKCLMRIFNVLVNILCEQESLDEISALSRRAKQITDKLNTTGVVSSGGKFEWVDSMLVQAVEQGYWLLIEDVNFCSSSVLDRLNSLLEPDGYLLITEQGVIDNEIKQVKPHPNFRIILTMDPKNGEISRAMRNRGIEIAFTPRDTVFDENGTFDKWDVIALAQCHGLTHMQMIEWLLNLHKHLRLKGVDMPSTYDFLNAVKVCVQSMQKFKDPTSAIWHSSKMIYVKSILNESSRKATDEIVREILTHVPDVLSESKFLYVSIFELLPSSIDFQSNNVLASIKQQGALFLYAVKYLTESFASDPMNIIQGKQSIRIPNLMSEMTPPSASTNEWVKIFLTIINIMFDSCSLREWRVISVWMEAILDQSLKDLIASEDESVYVEEIITLVLNFKQTHLDLLLDVPVAKELVATVDSISNSDIDIDRSQVSLDPRWNSFLWKKLIFHCNSDQVHKINTKITSLANKFSLLMCVSSLQFVEGDMISVKAESTGQSLYQLSEDILNESVTIKDIPHSVVTHVKPFISKIYVAIVNHLERGPSYYDDDEYWLVWEFLNIYYNFYQFCCEPLNRPFYNEHLEIFTLYWSMIMKRITQLFKPHEGSSSIPIDVMEIIASINRAVENENPSIRKLRSSLASNFGYPLPFTEEWEGKLFLEVINVYKHIDIYSIMKSRSRFDDMKVIVPNIQHWNRILFKSMIKCFEKLEKEREKKNGVFEVCSAVHNIKLQLIEAHLFEDDDDDVMEVCDNPPVASDIKPVELALNFELLPLWDYLFVFNEAHLLARAARITNIHTSYSSHQTSGLQGYEKFVFDLGLNLLNLNPAHLGQLIHLRFDVKGMLPICLVSFFNHIRSGPSSGNLNTCLNWQIEEQKVQSDSTPQFQQVSWANQSPVLTYICLHILNGRSKCLTDSLLLSNCQEKIEQIGKMNMFLWRCFEFLKNQNLSFRHDVSQIVVCWFNNLVYSIACMSESAVPLSDLLQPTTLLNLTEELNLTPYVTLANGSNLLTLAAKSIQILRISSEDASTTVQWNVGMSLAFVGLLTYILFAPLDLIDPFKKMEIKRRVYQNEFKKICNEYGFRSWLLQAVSGQELNDIKNDIHPRISKFTSVANRLNKKLGKLKNKVAFRPTPSKFYNLKNEVRRYLKSFGSSDEVYEIIMKLEHFWDQTASGKFDFYELPSFMHRMESWMKNQKSFISRLTEEFPLYGDLVYPFLAGVEQMVTGIEMMTHSLTSFQMRVNFPIKEICDIEQFVAQICTFPVAQDNGCPATPLQLASFLASTGTVQVAGYLSSLVKPRWNNLEITSKLMKSAFLELINEAVIFNCNSHAEILNLTSSILYRYFEVWKEQEQEREVQKEKDESLYEYRTRTHNGELSDEKFIEQEIKSMFPSFHQEFAAFIPHNLDDDVHDSEVEPLPSQNKQSTALTNDDMLEIWSMHYTLISVLCSESSEDENLMLKSTEEPNYEKSFILRYEILKILMMNLGNKFDAILDKHLIGSHLVASFLLQRTMQCTNDHSSVASKYYDIYKDPNVPEVLQCRPILDSLIHRLDSLLKEFPENPLLMQILNIATHIQSFAISSPLMKFVIGFELIHSSAQVWEENAHKGVSLLAELERISAKINQFRKLELDCWHQCLNNIMKKQYSNCAKWWFHLYSIIFGDFNDGGSFDPLKWEAEDKDKTMKALQIFMEDSSLGQYAARLSLLHTFLKHLQISSTNVFQKKMASVLFNVYTFYKQFLPAVETKIAEIRNPIEKELKEFVKIARWNDVNFYARTKAVEKSHRTIHKCACTFEKSLEKPARTVFIAPSKNDAEESEKSDWSLNIDPEEFVATKYKVGIMTDDLMKHTVFAKIPRYRKKAQKICTSVISSFPVLKSINLLNEYTGDIAERVKDLREKDVPKNLSKDRRLKKGRQLQHSKRKYLADLFKILLNMGLSYRQGLIYVKNRSESDTLSTPILSADTLKEVFSESSSVAVLSTCWSGANHFYYRCVAQFSLFLKQIETPSKELPLDCIHRCQGYVGNLMEIVVSQRHKIATDMENIKYFNTALETLQVLSSDDTFVQKLKTPEGHSCLPHQSFVIHWKGVLCNLLVQSVAALQQFIILMNACPDVSSSKLDMLYGGTEFFKITAISSESKGNQLWTDIICNTKKVLEAVKDIIKSVVPVAKSTVLLHTWTHTNDIRECFEMLSKVASDIKLLGKEMDPNEENSHFAASLKLLHVTITKQWNIFNENVEKMSIALEKSSIDSMSVADFTKQEHITQLIETLLTEILLSVQEVFTFSNEENERNEKEFSETSDPLYKLITDKINVFLTKASELLRIRKITSLKKKIFKYISKLDKSNEQRWLLHQSLQSVTAITPVLYQYFQLLKIYLVAAAGCHRTSCKLLTILLAVFTELAEKGFCIPTELKEEFEGKSIEFEDIHDGGLGEGEGVKDVSENITSEDQLEGCQKEGESEKSESKEEEPDLKDAEHGIEMSDDFDGKLHEPESKEGKDGDEESESDGESEELDKKMGDVEQFNSEVLDEKIWGSDSEDEKEQLEEESGSGGVTQNQSSEYAAKDDEEKEYGEPDKKKKKDNEREEPCPDLKKEEEYSGEQPDPLIDAPPLLEPEVMDLSEEMQIDEEGNKKDEEKGEEEEKCEANEPNKDSTEGAEDNKMEDTVENIDEKESNEAKNVDEEEVAEEDGKQEIEEKCPGDVGLDASEENLNELDTPETVQKPSAADDVIPVDDPSKNSCADSREQKIEEMDWKGGAQSSSEQHHEGQAEVDTATTPDSGHRGKKRTASSTPAQESKRQKPTLSHTDENKTVGAADNVPVEKLPIADKKTKKQDSEEAVGESDVFEHVEETKESDKQAIDTATDEQAEKQPVPGDSSDRDDEEVAEDEEEEEDEQQDAAKDEDDDDDDCIALDSSDEDTKVNLYQASKSTSYQEKGIKPGDADESDEEMAEDDADIVETITVERGTESIIHTQRDLWSALSTPHVQELRKNLEKKLTCLSHDQDVSDSSFKLWQEFEIIVSPLVQELCEQLRLVLEPTKMSKLKGDYRTGKRLNMRKIIPYIASQFKKDKIWLRRTKPNKRQYQIILAVDDSSSMADNHSKQLAFESLALLGKSLSFMEAGELCVLSFGERVKMLHEFIEPFTGSSGARIMEEFSFSQQKTRISELVNFATDVMIEGSMSWNQKTSKSPSQLLIIISDGRGIFNEGEDTVRKAIRRARASNIFMVFLVLDSPLNKDSILDIQCPVFNSNESVEIAPYMEKFPFPFYIILREISSLPQVLGEALRQWFELVTSAER